MDESRVKETSHKDHISGEIENIPFLSRAKGEGERGFAGVWPWSNGGDAGQAGC